LTILNLKDPVPVKGVPSTDTCPEWGTGTSAHAKAKGITRADNNNFMIGEKRVNGVVYEKGNQ
jgi:hypothetical protein